MLENRVATGLKVSAVLLALAIVHVLSNILGNLFILSDIFTVLGAVSVYRFLTDGFVRDEALDAFSDAIDLDETAAYLVAQGVELAANIGVAAAENLDVEEVLEDLNESFFIQDNEEDDTEIQDN